MTLSHINFHYNFILLRLLFQTPSDNIKHPSDIFYYFGHYRPLSKTLGHTLTLTLDSTAHSRTPLESFEHFVLSDTTTTDSHFGLNRILSDTTRKFQTLRTFGQHKHRTFMLDTLGHFRTLLTQLDTFVSLWLFSDNLQTRV